MDVIDHLVEVTQNVDSEYSSVVFNLGCTFESQGKLWKNTDAWAAAPDILTWLILGAAWALGVLKTPQVTAITCRQGETHWPNLSWSPPMGLAFHSLADLLSCSPTCVFRQLSLTIPVITRWQWALACAVIFHCGVLPDHCLLVQVGSPRTGEREWFVPVPQEASQWQAEAKIQASWVTGQELTVWQLSAEGRGWGAGQGCGSSGLHRRTLSRDVLQPRTSTRLGTGQLPHDWGWRNPRGMPTKLHVVLLRCYSFHQTDSK